MADPKGFMTHPRELPERRPVDVRIHDWREVYEDFPPPSVSRQAARCMDCGIPFCHNGCSLGNLIPEWNDLVRRDAWREAIERLHATNNFPEFTGRLCPAPCEFACVLGINSDPVTIKRVEVEIIDRAFAEGWVTPQPPAVRTGKRVAVVGSGPAGLAAAQQLARAGHAVTVFEKNDRIGGLLRYGIPDFKLQKEHIDRRLKQMRAEGVQFRPGVYVGSVADAKSGQSALTPGQLQQEFDAVVLAGGAETPRDLPLPGRQLDGVHFAMDFLPLQNRVLAGDTLASQILATDKQVVVIGGGDTGSDCVGTSNRQGAAAITQFELLPQPPAQENKPLTWPYWPIRLRTSSSHEEGCQRDWAVATKRFNDDGKGRVRSLTAVRLQWHEGRMSELPGSEFEIEADLVLLSMGFVSPAQAVLDAFGVDKDARGNAGAAVDGSAAYRTSVDKVFAAGDMRRGQSLVVWAIREGRQCARAVDEFLMGSSNLPR